MHRAESAQNRPASGQKRPLPESDPSPQPMKIIKTLPPWRRLPPSQPGRPSRVTLLLAGPGLQASASSTCADAAVCTQGTEADPEWHQSAETGAGQSLTPVLLETMKAIEGATEHIDALAQFAQDLSEWLQSFLTRIEQTLVELLQSILVELRQSSLVDLQQSILVAALLALLQS